MAWVDPDTQKLSVGDLVTEALWDQIQDNLNYLKGTAGAITIDAAVTISGNLSCEEIVCKNITFDGGYFRPANTRELCINWEEDDVSNNYQVDKRTAGANADVHEGGCGQVVVKLEGDGAGMAGMESRDAQNGALATIFTVTKKPYFRAEFGFDTPPATMVGFGDFFIGLRQTKGNSVPDHNAESFAGIIYSKTAGGYYPATGDGGGNLVQGTQQSWVASTRYVMEILFTGTAVEIWIDGIIKLNSSATLPTGTLDWAAQFGSDAGGAATSYRMTLGRVILQEALS